MRSLGVPAFVKFSLEMISYVNSSYINKIELVQYLNITIFLITTIYVFWRKQNLVTVILFAVFGCLTLFTILLFLVVAEK